MSDGNNNSDYNKKSTDLFNYLPETNRSDVNRSVMSNLLNRFLSKMETDRVAGYIGEGNPNAIVKRQIVEPTIHRQAFQLQPILYDKIGSKEHMASWKDIESELQRLGVDIDLINSWGQLLQFNWIPPIDIDKLVHYNDYYWVDTTTPNSKPQYITIRSRSADMSQCTAQGGWDIAQWDDNPASPLWNGDHETFLASISHASPPAGSATQSALWYDVTADILYQYDATGATWVVIWNTFSDVLANTNGLALWDLYAGCPESIQIPAVDQWSSNNNWVHKTDVGNFTTAKPAQYPIIEYQWDLELNEWSHVNYDWKYRQSFLNSWSSTDVEPSLFELTPIEFWTVGASNELVFHEKYGDLTDWFTPGKQFQAIDTTEVYVVDHSVYKTDVVGEPYKTRVTITVDVSSTALISATLSPISASLTPLHPLATSMGDLWKGYGQHWLFGGVLSTEPVNHQVPNPFVDLSSATVVSDPVNGYDYRATYYAQDYIVQVAGTATFYFSDQIFPGVNVSLRQRALLGHDDIRVYINGVRQYGTYDELDALSPTDGFVDGITFFPGYEPPQYSSVRVEIGEAAMSDLGHAAVPVRMEPVDDLYVSDVVVSLTRYKKSEQVKTSTIQYPMFDIYNVDGTSHYDANPIFGFKTDSSADVVAALGLRLVYDSTTNNFEFDQFMLSEDNGKLYAYRDYSNLTDQYWYNTTTGELNFWGGFTWTTKQQIGEYYIPAYVSAVEPTNYIADIDGAYWFDTTNLKLFTRNVATLSWTEVTGVAISTSDETLQTIWKKGLNDETYVPEKVDWQGRTQDEYNTEQANYIEVHAQEVWLQHSDWTYAQAEEQATIDWYDSQINTHSPTGIWIGDWEIPDPLYYNNLSENRKYLSSRELVTHFTSIIQSQPTLPGYTGSKDYMFHLIPSNEVNYGLGGKIKQYNSAYSTFLSAIFNDTVTPSTLIEFARDQYDILLSGLREVFLKHITTYMTDTTQQSIVNFAELVSAAIQTIQSQDDSLANIYGDTTTFTEVTGSGDLGVRNWIATLPYLQLVFKVLPAMLTDSDLGLTSILHHDGHIRDYSIEPAVIESIIRTVVTTVDIRSTTPDTFGRISSSLPPNTLDEFSSNFNSSVANRIGVYWYYTPSPTTRTLYRLKVVSTGTTSPSPSYPDGSLWIDMTAGAETLRQKVTSDSGVVSWPVVDGLSLGDRRLHNGTNPSDVTTATISAWETVDLSTVFATVVYDVEMRLYDNVPETIELKYDLEATKALYPTQFTENMYERFSTYALTEGISSPLLNSDYSTSDPFTWNYKYSTINLYPSSSNLGTESGGDWRDLYTKLYGTPYPHLEPWVLQGYTSKPLWWDTEYLNDDTTTWGTRKWKYKHGFEVTSVDAAQDYFGVVGDFTNVFATGVNISIDKSVGVHDGSYVVGYFNAIDADISLSPVLTGTAGTAAIRVLGNATTDYTVGVRFVVTDTIGTVKGVFTVVSRSYDSPLNTTTIIVKEAITSATGFDVISSRFVPSTATTLIKVTADITSTTVSGRIALVVGSPAAPHGYGMWENIRTGTIPSGQLPPTNVTVPTYEYFSVNVGNDAYGVYKSDEIFPPYLDYVPTGIDSIIRSVFTSFSTEVVAPGANYAFGDSGPIEWEWMTSTSYLYDQFVVAFRLDPINFIADTFGFDLLVIGGLEVDRRLETVPRHMTTIFHGEVDGSDVYRVNGLNQWYMNYLRYTGNDASFSNFRSMWTSWTAPLTYQFSSFIDTSSFDLTHRYVSVTENDYNLTSKQTLGASDDWLDVFDVSITSIPPKLARYDNQQDWRLEVDTNLSISRTIKYYDVQNYQFRADPTTDTCTIYQWEVVSIDAATQLITIKGDQTAVMVNGREITITGVIGNNGTYVVSSGVYEAATNTTLIAVQAGTLISTTGGFVTANYRSIPWETGFGIYLSTVETLPSPLLGDTVNGLTKYFIIVESSNTFKLARTQQDALNGVAIDITSTGRRDHFVGSVKGTFTALSGRRVSTVWRHYEVDKTSVLTLITPSEIQGMQTLVNIVDGYDSYSRDSGWRINEDSSLRDTDTGAVISWQSEIERFIDFAYGVQVQQYEIPDKQEITVNDTTDEWTFVGENLQYITGDAVSIFSSNGVYPEPIVRGITYYMIRDTLTTFRLAVSKQDALAGVAIDITSLTGGTLYISPSKLANRIIVSQEINPIRTSIWYRPVQGIVSNMITGPYTDIRTAQLIFDQYGRPLKVDTMRILRQDTITQIAIADGIPNDVEYQVVTNPYNYIHLGGAHIFLDTYEHVLRFNNYTTDDLMLYDPFIGLNVTKFELLFNRGTTFTGRPNVGGYYLSTYYNQGMDLNKNIEANVESLRTMFDTNSSNEKDLFVRHARDLLGYEGTRSYLDLINVNDKSQFLFWKGLIQYKGSLNAMTAFINSRRFIDAKLDEFWAIKIADFGSIGEQEYPEMYLTVDDTRTNEFRVQFSSDSDLIDNTFTAVKITDSDRWYNHPDVVSMLSDNGLILKFRTQATNAFALTVAGNSAGIIHHSLKADEISVTLTSITGTTTELVADIDYRIINADIVEILNDTLTGDLKIWAIMVNHNAQNPAKLLDKKSEVVLTPIQHWDPAHGYHYYAAIHNIDLQDDVDPAVFGVTERTQDFTNDAIDISRIVPWGKPQVGTTWLDTHEVDYVPYYDTKAFPDVDDRISYWGQLADWSTINVYEWVRSDVAPSDYDAAALVEEGDITIPENTRKAGRVRNTIFQLSNALATLGSPAEAEKWEVIQTGIERHNPVIDGTPGINGTYIFATNFIAGDVVNIYVNGLLVTEAVTVPVDKMITVDCASADYVQIVMPTPDITTLAAGSVDTEKLLSHTELFTATSGQVTITLNRIVAVGATVTVTVNGVELAQTEFTYTENSNTIVLTTPASLSDSIAVTYDEKVIVNYEYTVQTEYTSVGIEQTYYYFWVKSKSTRAGGKNRSMPNSEVEKTLVSVPAPYMFFQHPSTISDYTQVILHGLRGWIDASRRYTIRFTRDFTLRDTLEGGTSSLALKDKHEEWELFREGQQYHIMRSLWDKITEAMIGHLLTDSTIRVPSYERELYDSKYDTDTRYGLGDGQAFTDGSMALDTIMADLTNPNNSFYPIDIDEFFNENSFDTTENIITAMDTIYNTFAYEHVNRITFSVLHDAFSLKSKYPDIFKTSMVSLNGIRPLQDLGIFDD